ncbi:MAG TPA: ABC transporter substrate-binding protein [Longimicrobiales bacterium]|nr:ABC transporter substrate-binding protein [Longimicrobiales bacterium]
MRAISMRHDAPHRRPAGAVLALAAAGLTACAQPGNTVEIALAGPVSTPAYVSMQHAANMAVAEINAAGGVGGRTLELVVRDDSTRPERAIAIATELVADPRVVAVVGHLNSAATLAAAPIYNDPARGLVNVSPASSSPLVTDAGPWTFRVCPSDLQHGPALAAWAVNHLRDRRAVVLYSNDDYGRGVLTSFSDAFRALGGQVLSQDPYLPAMLDSIGNPDPYLRRGIRNHMNVLVIAGQAADGAAVLRQARADGYAGAVMGADGLTGLRDAGSVANGVYVSSAWLPDQPGEASQQFVQAYRERYNAAPDQFGAMTYDAVRLLAQAIGEVGPDRTAIRNYLERVGRGSPAFRGVSGTIAFDQNGDVANTNVVVGVIRDGKLVSAQ